MITHGGFRRGQIQVYYATGYKPFNIHGEPVERTKADHPYGYDSHLVLRHRENVEGMCGTYSDRMEQWDYKKYYDLKQKFAPRSHGSSWNGAGGKEIEDFLRAYFDKPELQFIGMEEGCNVSNGYPYWVFFYV